VVIARWELTDGGGVGGDPSYHLCVILAHMVIKIASMPVACLAAWALVGWLGAKSPSIFPIITRADVSSVSKGTTSSY
jgi:hypothetical protein